jgi:hypothetical protein
MIIWPPNWERLPMPALKHLHHSVMLSHCRYLLPEENQTRFVMPGATVYCCSYITGVVTMQTAQLHRLSLIRRNTSLIAAETCLPIRCLAPNTLNTLNQGDAIVGVNRQTGGKIMQCRNHGSQFILIPFSASALTFLIS